MPDKTDLRECTAVDNPHNSNAVQFSIAIQPAVESRVGNCDAVMAGACGKPGATANGTSPFFSPSLDGRFPPRGLVGIFFAVARFGSKGTRGKKCRASASTTGRSASVNSPS